MTIIRKSFLVSACLLAPLSIRLAAQSLPSPGPTLQLPMHLALAARTGESQQTSAQTLSAQPSLSLETLQQMASARNPTLGQAQAGIRAAAGRTLQAGLWPNPTVGYTGEEIRGGSFGGGQHGVFIQQPIILGGKLGLSRKVFAEEGKQTEAEAEEQQLRVENGVRVAFYQSLAAQEMLETRNRLRALAQDAVQTTLQLFNVGQADQPDVLQAQVEADEADLEVVSAEQDQQRAWRVLAAVVGKPELVLTRLQGNLEDLPQIAPDQVMQTILRDSPAVKIADLGVTRADAALTREHREVIPDLSVRAGYLNNREQLGTIPPRAVGSEGFAEVGVNLRFFNRNQGNIAAATADRQHAQLEVQRVALVLRQTAAPVIQSYASSRALAETYKMRTLPNAQRAYDLYLQRYREGAAAYPQVLITQRTLFQLQASYISALERVWMNAITLQGLLLTDGLDLPAGPGDFDRPVREINMPVTEAPGTMR